MSQVTAEVHKRVVEKLERCLEIANDHFNTKFEMPEIAYDVRGTKGGWVYSHINIVHYNPTLLMENVDDFIARTVPHELAHILDYNVSGRQYRGNKRSVHGPTWKRMMMLLGAPVSRCHSYDTTNARVKLKQQHEYICTCCKKSVMLGPKRHAKQQRLGHVYSHSGCGRAQLVLASEYNSVKKAAETKKPAKKSSGGASKKVRAQRIFNNNPNASRSDVINMFMTQLNMTKSGASTYYYNCKK